MLDSYVIKTTEERNRLEAVKAALEIVKASISAPTAYTGYQKLKHDSDLAIEKVELLADAIQSALEKK
ncbi:hypothetical protein [Serratia proteamaculans]|uniref:hypothetical protein n=1 Tax=Serratia proteamaculans TaxID=28151 RepID=UPI00217B7B8B|nr:hypothetical protein [Serratia proteamaculans]CAI0816114.1 Uncharacterised protein [Serratia proteamaculans]